MDDEHSNPADDDAEFFRRHVADARPLDRDLRAPDYRRPPPARARFRREDERAVLRESLEADVDEIETAAGESLSFRRPAIGRRTLRKLARGSFSVQAEIDLHGFTVPEAKAALRAFINDAVERGHTCVRVIHGKGLGSGQRGPVLKSKVNHWLRRWHEVLAFISTRQVHGGTGAINVLLRKD